MKATPYSANDEAYADAQTEWVEAGGEPDDFPSLDAWLREQDEARFENLV